MANVTDIVKCMKTLVDKNESSINEESHDGLHPSCDQSCDRSSKQTKCLCHHHSSNTKLNVVLKERSNLFFSALENCELKNFVHQKGNSTFVTDCLCYGGENELFQQMKCTSDSVWQFVVTCLKILLALTETLDDLQDNEAPAETVSNKDAEYHNEDDTTSSPNVIGVQDEETISSVIELIVSFGIFPNLLEGVGRTVKARAPLQNALGKSKISMKKLLVIVKVLLQMMKNKILHAVILSKHINDIIATLIQLRYCPTKKGKVVKVQSQCCCVSVERDFKGCVNCSGLCRHEKEWCESELDFILVRTYQPLIVKELLILQCSCTLSKNNSSRWFGKIIGYQLSKCMIQQDGVKYVVEGILAGCSADSIKWEKYKSVGRLIAHVPSQVSNSEEYYKVISPQILKFVGSSNSSKTSQLGSSPFSTQYVMIAVATMQEMLEFNYKLAQKYLVDPLLHPLKQCFSSGSMITINGSELLACVTAIQLICSIGANISEKATDLLSQVMHPLFVILCLHEKKDIRECLCSSLVYLLHHMKTSDCVQWLSIFMFDSPTTATNVNSANIVNKDARFATSIGHEEGKLNSESVVSIDEICTEEKVSSLLYVLKEEQLKDARGEFFVVLLQQLSCLLQCGSDQPQTSATGGNSQELLEIDGKISDVRSKIQLLSVISALLDTFGHEVLQNTPQTVAFIKAILDLPWKESGEMSLTDVDDSHDETVDLVLMLISILLKTEKLTSSDFVILNTLLPSLTRAGSYHSKESSRNLANDLKIYISTRGAVKLEQTSATPNARNVDLSSKEAYDTAMKELTDPLLPTRGHALFQLSKLLKLRNKYAVKDHKRLFDIFETNLAHHDTYLYLAAVEGLLALVDIYHRDVLPLLCRKFAQFHNGDTSSGEKVTLSSELRMKLGEAIVKSCRLCGDLLPMYCQVLLSALMTGVKDEDELVRASSLSAVGEVCLLMKFSIGSISKEIVSCIQHVVSTDKSVQVRRAAVQVFTLMFKGTGTSLLQDCADSVREIYHLLKTVLVHDEDALTQLHASNALQLLDQVVNDTLFPKVTLEKKIQIVD